MHREEGSVGRCRELLYASRFLLNKREKKLPAVNPDWKVSGKGARLPEIPHHFQLARQCSTAYKTSSAVFPVVANRLHRERQSTSCSIP